MANVAGEFRAGQSLSEKADRPSQPRHGGPLSSLFRPVEIDFLVYFRIAFGAIMLWEVWRYLEAGWVRRNFIEPPLHFSFYGFEWVKPWPGDGMYWHFYALGALATMIAVGLFYRAAAALFFLAFTYVFLLDQAFYLNHFYLVCLISFAMIFLPAGRAFSLDAAIRRKLRKSPPVAGKSPPVAGKSPPVAPGGTAGQPTNSHHSTKVPAWTLWTLRALVGIVYFYGGLAKLNSDWLSGNPMRAMLAAADTFPVVGRFFHQEPVILFYAYAGLLLDLLIVPALTWKRTRLLALIAAAVFHLSNDMLFRIGIFPWFMLTATLLLWPPRPGRHAPAQSRLVSSRPLWLLRTMVATVYVYGSLALLNTPLGDEAAVRYAGLAGSLLCLPLMAWKPVSHRARPVGFLAFLAAAGWLLFSVWYWGPGGMPGTLVSLLPALVLFSAILVFPPESLREFRITAAGPAGDRGTQRRRGDERERRREGERERQADAGTRGRGDFGAFPSVPLSSAPALSVSPSLHHSIRSPSLSERLTVAVLGLFLAVQLLVPFRHFLYPGNVNWTEEGHLFAWHMKLRYKLGRAAFRAFDANGEPIPEVAAGGFLLLEYDGDGRPTHVLDAQGTRRFTLRERNGRRVAHDPAGSPVYEMNREGWFTYELDREGRRIYALDPYGERIYQRDERGRPVLVRDSNDEIIPERRPPYFLLRRQMQKMAERPDMIVQYAHFLAGVLNRIGYEQVDVRADVFCSLNGRREQRLIDPDVNLANVERSLGHADWIVPLDPELKPGVLYRQMTMGEP